MERWSSSRTERLKAGDSPPALSTCTRASTHYPAIRPGPRIRDCLSRKPLFQQRLPGILTHHPVHNEMVALLEFLDGSKRPGPNFPISSKRGCSPKSLNMCWRWATAARAVWLSRRTGRLTSVSWNWAAVAAEPSVMAPSVETDTTRYAEVQEAVNSTFRFKWSVPWKLRPLPRPRLAPGARCISRKRARNTACGALRHKAFPLALSTVTIRLLDEHSLPPSTGVARVRPSAGRRRGRPAGEKQEVAGRDHD